jgi:tetratricopeptide (TPR) repeat protein
MLFLFDHSENVDYDDRRWQYSGRKIAEMELWYVFVSSLKNCIGVIASRRAAPPLADETLKIEEKELVELDRNSSRDLLTQRGVTDANLQEQIVSISAGNPFVINAICDMHEVDEISIDDLEGLRADTLDEVRLKTWRRLFSYTKDLLNLIDRAGLLPSFHKELMSIVAPDMKTDQWERLIRLSFVKPRSNGSFVLHDLARDLVRAELGVRMNQVASEVSGLIKEAAEREKDTALFGFALSVKALDSEKEAIGETKVLIRELIGRGLYVDALKIVDNLEFQTYQGDLELLGQRGIVCANLNRFSEAEFLLSGAIRSFEELDPELHKTSIGSYSYNLGWILHETGRFTEAEQAYLRGLENLRVAAESQSEWDLYQLSNCLRSFAFFFYRAQRASEGLSYALEALEIARKLDYSALLPLSINVAAIMLGNAGQLDEQAKLYQEAIELQRKNIEKSPDSPGEKAHLAALLGNFSFNIQNTEEAEEIYKEIFQIREELADIYPVGLVFSKMHYGGFCLRRSRFREAELFIKEALAFYTKDQESDSKAWPIYIYICRLLLAEVYILNDRPAQAKELIDVMLPTDMGDLNVKTSTQLVDIMTTMGLSGFYHFQFSHLTKAKADLESSIEIMSRLTIDTGEEASVAVWCLCTYGILCWVTGEYDEARRALRKAKETVNLYGTAWWSMAFNAALNANLALVLYTESKFEKAVKISEKAIQVLDGFSEGLPEMVIPRLSKIHNNLSLMFRRLDRDDKALEAIQRSMAMKRESAEKGGNLFKASLSASLNNRGSLLHRLGKTVESEKDLEEALKLQREMVEQAPDKHSLNLASILQNLSIVINERGDIVKSKKYFKEATDLRKRLLNKAPEVVSEALELDFDDVVKNKIWSEVAEPIYIMF